MGYELRCHFGGCFRWPESQAEAIPFLENVFRARNVPSERLLAVAEHYYHFDGKSPINQLLCLEMFAEDHTNNLKIGVVIKSTALGGIHHRNRKADCAKFHLARAPGIREALKPR
jgi:hypothetical protein